MYPPVTRDATDQLPLDLCELLRGGSVRIASSRPARPREHREETPIHGHGAVARWLALHDRAYALRAALHPGDGVDERQALRAIRSLFLYEHQLLPATRRQAHAALWRRDRAEPLPVFAERARWSRCRCAVCQPAIHQQHTEGYADGHREGRASGFAAALVFRIA